MPSKPSSQKAERVVRRKLADGTEKVYRYQAYKPDKAARFAPDSVEALIRAYQISPKWNGLADNTRAVYSGYLRDLQAIGDVRVADVRRRALLELQDAIAVTRGNGAATGFMRATSAVFSYAVERQWIEHSPATKIPSRPGGHLPAWTQQQADKAIELLPEPLRRLVVLAMHTGQRRGDLAAMVWSAYDGQTIRLKQQKTGAELVIPVTAALKRELDTWRKDATSTVILTDSAGIPWKPQRLSEHLPRALAKIGLPAGMNVHGLRKLAATNLAQAGCTMHEIAAITGHASLSMVQLYTKSADQERLAEAAIHRLQTPAKKRYRVDKA